MASSLDRAPSTRKSGSERFRDGLKELDFDLLSFWQWSASDLVSNATRGIVAEYLVARAISANAEGVRDEWAAYDLETEDGVKVEVKSAAFLQSWYQVRPSRVSFIVPKARAWDPSTNFLSEKPVRQADVYVFALLAHQDKLTIDPMDVGQWTSMSCRRRCWMEGLGASTRSRSRPCAGFVIVLLAIMNFEPQWRMRRSASGKLPTLLLQQFSAKPASAERPSLPTQSQFDVGYASGVR